MVDRYDGLLVTGDDLDEKGKASLFAGNATVMLAEYGSFAEPIRALDKWYEVSGANGHREKEITDLRSKCLNIRPDRPKGAYMMD